MKFGISTLMGLVFVAAIICGIALQGSFVAFAIGFGALAVLIMQLMRQSGPRPVTVHEADNEADAHLVRNYLVEHGIAAQVESDRGSTIYPGVMRPRVVVPLEQAEQGDALLLELQSLIAGRTTEWIAILHNCNCHSFDDVVRELVQAIACSTERARHYAFEVHTRGQAVICVGSESECTKVAESLDAAGLHLEVCRNDIPAPGVGGATDQNSS